MNNGLKDWLPTVTLEEADKTTPSYFGVDRTTAPVRFNSAPSKRNSFLRRLLIVARELPRLIRDAWRDSRYPYEGRISAYGNIFYENPKSPVSVEYDQ